MQIGYYHYRRGPDNIGIGVDNMAYERSTTIPAETKYGSKYNVHRDFTTHAPAGQFPLIQSGPTVDLRANGAYLSGDFALSQLTDFNKAVSGGK